MAAASAVDGAVVGAAAPDVGEPLVDEFAAGADVVELAVGVVRSVVVVAAAVVAVVVVAVEAVPGVAAAGADTVVVVVVGYLEHVSVVAVVFEPFALVAFSSSSSQYCELIAGDVA